MALSLRRLLIGRPFETARQHHERLPKFLALPVFASDALSSSAYATEEILLALMLASTAAFHVAIPIAIGIAVLLVIVAISYRQTVLAYPTGGGAYIVSKDNLGVLPATIAAAALLVDYVLTVSVSVAAGVAAITSAYEPLRPWAVHLSLACIALIALANLRGVRESGALFALPTYGFIFSMVALLGVAAWKLFTGAPITPPHYAAENGGHSLTAFLVLRAFASGCAALTGVEAISNGVQAFRSPEGRNAAATMLWMAGILGVLFLGITYFARAFQLVPVHGGETIISQLGRTVFGNGPFYLLVQASTAAILVLAANTSFADFPRLGAILARDRFLPRQLSNIGDRLVFNNGILILALLSAALVVMFKGDVHLLIPLYAVGVFLSFTLSQSGMVRHWRKLAPSFPGWRRPAIINGVGAVATAVVLVVIAGTKFTHGAWMVVVLIPFLVVAFYRIHSHYGRVAEALSMDRYEEPPALRNTVLVLINTVHRGIMPAVHYARTMGDDVRGVYCEIDPEKTGDVQRKWAQWIPDIPLVIVQSPFRSLTQPILDYIDEVQAERQDDIVTVLLPEFDPANIWARVLHNQSGLRLKWRLLNKPGVVVTNIRYHLGQCPGEHIPSHLFQNPPSAR